MIRVRYRPGEYEITATGHAGYAESGSDIVCAGTSAILNALLGAASGMRERVVPAARMKEGEFYLRLHPQKERDKLRARTIMDMAYIGLERIETEMGQWISCTIEEE